MRSGLKNDTFTLDHAAYIDRDIFLITIVIEAKHLHKNKVKKLTNFVVCNK